MRVGIQYGHRKPPPSWSAFTTRASRRVVGAPSTTHRFEGFPVDPPRTRKTHMPDVEPDHAVRVWVDLTAYETPAHVRRAALLGGSACVTGRDVGRWLERQLGSQPCRRGGVSYSRVARWRRHLMVQSRIVDAFDTSTCTMKSCTKERNWPDVCTSDPRIG